MKKILKIGDPIYTQSLQHFSPSYLTAFPQREQFLFQQLRKKVRFQFFKHQVIRDLDDVSRERKKLQPQIFYLECLILLFLSIILSVF